jgi:predicted Zn-dependent protease
VVPARELLGDLFLELKRPADALAAYEASAQREPNRLLGIYGIAQAAALTGDREKARAYYARLTEIARHAEPGRPELERAKERLAQR